jgi:hypothetical protein
MKCTVTDCDANATAKGLCQKHYMRQRRTGSADKTRRPGRPKDAALTVHRRLMESSFSERTFARYAKAMRFAQHLGPEMVKKVIKSPHAQTAQ